MDGIYHRSPCAEKLFETDRRHDAFRKERLRWKKRGMPGMPFRYIGIRIKCWSNIWVTALYWNPFALTVRRRRRKRKGSCGGGSKLFWQDAGAVDDLDMDGMEEVIQEMDQYRYEGWQKEMFARLKEAVEEIDVDSCEAIMIEWEGKLEDGDGN